MDNASHTENIENVCKFFKSELSQDAAYFCNSCSDALEIAALALDLSEHDEVIVPDYAFVTTASSFALRGAQLLFCDILLEDMSLDLDMAEKLITKNTKALVWIDYGGSALRVSEARALCDKYNIVLIQDAAQAVGNWLSQPVSDCILGDFITFSFHSTKNINSGGEGGLLIVRNLDYLPLVEMIFEKGTNRTQFLRGEVDKYTWRCLGSSFAGSYSQAGLLIPQLNYLSQITNDRIAIWNSYHRVLSNSKEISGAGWRVQNKKNRANAHIFWLLAPDQPSAINLIESLSDFNIQAASHYKSLSSSPAGRVYGKTQFDLSNSLFAIDCIVRLPLWHGLDQESALFVSNKVSEIIENQKYYSS
jgi:dTDP-4-amino-4,6-dideoxygalactose transaminase